jgi:hypothetical protein
MTCAQVSVNRAQQLGFISNLLHTDGYLYNTNNKINLLFSLFRFFISIEHYGKFYIKNKINFYFFYLTCLSQSSFKGKLYTGN